MGEKRIQQQEGTLTLVLSHPAQHFNASKSRNVEISFPVQPIHQGVIAGAVAQVSNRDTGV
jgi:hypothetical protein